MKISNGTNSPKTPLIRDVYEDTFLSEIKLLSSYLDEYNYIGMDTEFPGTCFKLSSYSQDFYYRSIKKNADELKLIQLGITLCNSKGEYPPECSTWQFNFQFDLKCDTFSQDSISLLMNSGINFEVHKTKGIPHELFAEYFIVSGLLLNPHINWISYHGSSDFAYLLRLALNTPLPKSENDFTNTLELYFPNHFDIKILIHGKEQFKGGLNKLAQCLDIYRTGEVHQAGSDSIVTVELFFALLTNKIVTVDTVKTLKNVIYGIGEGEDNKETINYIMFDDNVLAMKNEYEQQKTVMTARDVGIPGTSTLSTVTTSTTAANVATAYNVAIHNTQQQQQQQTTFNTASPYTHNTPSTPTHNINNMNNRNQMYYPYMNYGKQSVTGSSSSNSSNYMLNNVNISKPMSNVVAPTATTSANAMPPMSPIPSMNPPSHQMNGNNLFRSYYTSYV